MANLAPKTVVANGECADCGKPVPIKLNVNGIAYYYCQWPDATGERCSHHQKWGRSMSRKFQADYLASRSKTPIEETKDEQRHSDVQEQPQRPETAGNFLCD